jgi:capsular polysaccharide biosynthesis protein
MRWGWIVAVLAVVVAGGAYLYSKRQTPIYEASLTISVRPVRANQDLGQSIAALLRSLAGDIATHKFLGEVIAHGQYATSTDALLSGKRLMVEPQPADFTIGITVRDPEPGLAVGVANGIAALFVAQREEWNENQNQEVRVAVEVLDYARNADLYSPQPRMYVVAGGALGVAIGAAIVAVLEWLEAGAVRTREDLDRLEVRVLGAIPSRGGRAFVRRAFRKGK